VFGGYTVVLAFKTIELLQIGKAHIRAR